MGTYCRTFRAILLVNVLDGEKAALAQIRELNVYFHLACGASRRYF